MMFIDVQNSKITRWRFWTCLLAGVLTAGCGEKSGSGEEGLILVNGTISLNGQPIPNTEVKFLPQGNTTGHGGSGTTDSTGRYEVISPYGAKGLPPGEYKVTVSRRLNPDGSPPAPNEMPIESNARETLPARYSEPDRTMLKATIAAGDTKPIDFSLSGAKK